MPESEAFAIATQAALDGELLGDGSLFVGKRYSNARFQLQPAYEGQARFAEGSLFDFGGKTVSFVRKVSGFRSSPSVVWMYNTPRIPTITVQWKRWYPNHTKAVPEDFILSQTSALHWYVGDGSLHKQNPRIVFCTDSFDDLSVQRLMTQLRNNDFSPRLTKSSKKASRIELGVGDVEHFLHWIGPCPVPELSYKWEPQFRAKRNKWMSEEELVLLWQLHAEGMKIGDISRKLGRSYHTVYSIVVMRGGSHA
jgi:hypothetical protein